LQSAAIPDVWAASRSTIATATSGPITANNNDGTFIGPSEIIATPVCWQNRVYVATGQDPSHGRGKGMLSCIDATLTGDVTRSGLVWRYDGIDRSLSTVSIADGLLYVADIPGTLRCLEAETGRVCWEYATGAEVWASTLVADGKVYLPTKKGLLVLAAGRQLKVLGDVRLGAPAWCTPVAATACSTSARSDTCGRFAPISSHHQIRGARGGVNRLYRDLPSISAGGTMAG